jgi:hypothetical protein
LTNKFLYYNPENNSLFKNMEYLEPLMAIVPKKKIDITTALEKQAELKALFPKYTIVIQRLSADNHLLEIQISTE